MSQLFDNGMLTFTPEAPPRGKKRRTTTPERWDDLAWEHVLPKTSPLGRLHDAAGEPYGHRVSIQPQTTVEAAHKPSNPYGFVHFQRSGKLSPVSVPNAFGTDTSGTAQYAASYRYWLSQRYTSGVTKEQSELLIRVARAWISRRRQGRTLLEPPRFYGGSFLAEITQGQLPLSVAAPSVEERFCALLKTLEPLVQAEKKFDAKVVAQFDELLDEQESARACLLRVARGEEPTRTCNPHWSSRLRWFALDQLRHWPVQGYAETLVEAIEGWPEDEALYGAVVAVRYQAVDLRTRERLRVAFRRRLEARLASGEAQEHIFKSQLTGQVLSSFGSFATAEDLDLLWRFGSGDYPFAVLTNALGSLCRVVSRHPDKPLTSAFYGRHAAALADKCRIFIGSRRAWEYAGSLLWSTVAVLVARLGEEALQLIELAEAYPKLHPDLAREINKAADALHRQGGLNDYLAIQRPTLERLRQGISPL